MFAGLRISSILNHRYEVISGINRHLFDIFCEQFNRSGDKPLGHLSSVIYADTDNIKANQPSDVGIKTDNISKLSYYKA